MPIKNTPSPAEMSPSLELDKNSTSQASLHTVSIPKAILSSAIMAMMFVLGLAWIQILLNRATPDGDSIVLALKYCSMGAGYSLLALPVWGIFDTLRRTHLYAHGPKLIIAFGYISLMSAFLYVAYNLVSWTLTKLL